MCMPVAPVFFQPIQGRYQQGQTITSFCHVLTSFRWKTAFLKKKTKNKELTGNIFITSQEDDYVSLSCKDCKFLYIMETGLQKNDQGNWEKPLPFHCEDPHLPNNQSQAINRVNGLFYTLKRKPQMAKDYWLHREDNWKRPHLSSANRRTY